LFHITYKNPHQKSVTISDAAGQAPLKRLREAVSVKDVVRAAPLVREGLEAVLSAGGADRQAAAVQFGAVDAGAVDAGHLARRGARYRRRRVAALHQAGPHLVGGEVHRRAAAAVLQRVHYLVVRRLSAHSLPTRVAAAHTLALLAAVQVCNVQKSRFNEICTHQTLNGLKTRIQIIQIIDPIKDFFKQ
jgi:hypothetical protein